MRRKVDRLKVLGTPSDKAKHLRRAENEAIRARLEDIEAGRIKGDLFSEGFDGDPSDLVGDPGTEGWYLDQSGLLVVNDAIIRAGTTVEMEENSGSATLTTGTPAALVGSVTVTPPDWATHMSMSAVGVVEFEAISGGGTVRAEMAMGSGSAFVDLKFRVVNGGFQSGSIARARSVAAGEFTVELWARMIDPTEVDAVGHLAVTTVFEKTLS